MIPQTPIHPLAAALAIGIALFITPVRAVAETPDKPRPNILIIYVDDLARGDVGAFGCPDPGTDNIDRIAAQGVRMTHAFTNNVPCSPSRSALMMGMYTQRFGKFGLSRGVPIPEDKPTLAETLRDAGYVTGIVGLEKWDIGTWNQGALDRGFMEAAMQPPRVEGREGFGGGSSYLSIDGSYLTETEGEDALDFITRHGMGERPFFLYFVPLAVHIPLTEVPKKYLDRLYPGHEGKYTPRQTLRASLLALDDQIGRILDKLEEMDIAKNTLVIFSSDNGGDPVAGHRPLPFRGGKGGVNRTNLQWEGNYRMPTILSYPGTLPAGASYSGMSCTLDFYATAAAVAGVPLPEHCEGKNLLPLLLGEVEPDPDEIRFWNTHGSRIARWQQWRIVQFLDETSWRLYDIEADPAETTNLADQHPDVVNSIAARYDAWMSEMPAPAPAVMPPDELLPYTNDGQHARRPFGRGWMTVETWSRIKDDPTQWGESHVRRRMLEGK
ncbi:MAG: sulfatase [Luteolibacter sp.]